MRTLSGVSKNDSCVKHFGRHTPLAPGVTSYRIVRTRLFLSIPLAVLTGLVLALIMTWAIGARCRRQRGPEHGRLWSGSAPPLLSRVTRMLQFASPVCMRWPVSPMRALGSPLLTGAEDEHVAAGMVRIYGIGVVSRAGRTDAVVGERPLGAQGAEVHWVRRVPAAFLITPSSS